MSYDCGSTCSRFQKCEGWERLKREEQSASSRCCRWEGWKSRNAPRPNSTWQEGLRFMLSASTHRAPDIPLFALPPHQSSAWPRLDEYCECREMMYPPETQRMYPLYRFGLRACGVGSRGARRDIRGRDARAIGPQTCSRFYEADVLQLSSPLLRAHQASWASIRYSAACPPGKGHPSRICGAMPDEAIACSSQSIQRHVELIS